MNNPSTARRSPWLILTVLCASVFIIVVDGTIVNVALPTFVRNSAQQPANCNGSSTPTCWCLPGC